MTIGLAPVACHSPQTPAISPRTASVNTNLTDVPGYRAAGSVLLPNQWSLRPVGPQVAVGDVPSTIALHPDTRDEADRLFAALSEGGTDINPMTDMFWGDYWGTCLDRFGVRWMFDVPGGAAPSVG